MRIDHVDVANAGPIREFREDFAPLTLIYAPNERGKTTLVENMTACLFRRQETRELRLREGEFAGTASVQLQQADGSVKRLKATSKTKLEDLLSPRRVGEGGSPSPVAGSVSSDGGLPAGFTRLLVVRGAESGLDAPGGGLSARRLKDLMSPQALYEGIRRNFGGSFVNYTRVEDGEITGDRKGRNKDYQQARERYDRLRRAADRFYEAVSQPQRVAAEKTLEQMKGEREQLRRAKRYRAYQRARRRDEIEGRYTEVYRERVQELRARLRDYQSRRAELERHRQDGQDTVDHREHAGWLEAARDRYTAAQAKARNLLQQAALIAAAALAVLAAVFYFIPNLSAVRAAGAGFLVPAFEIAAALAVLALLLAVVATFVTKRSSTPEAAREERAEIGREFRRRFGIDLRSRADLDAMQQQESRLIGAQEQREAVIRTARQELADTERDLRDLLRELHVDPNVDWERSTRSLEEDMQRALSELNSVREELSALGVDPSDYLKEDPGLRYSRSREAQVAAQIEKLEAQIDDLDTGYEKVRRELAEFLPSDVLWNGTPGEIVGALDEKLREIAAERDHAYYDIRAAHVVEAVLEGFQAREDERLTSVLNDGETLELIRAFTGRYDRMEVEGDTVRLGVGEDLYDFADLSTGAREQILLALRMGIARRLAGDVPLFLLLDDAFQYADWDRRTTLVARAVDMVREDWQVVYFTMDDDIRDRFVRAAADLKPEDFRVIEI